MHQWPLRLLTVGILAASSISSAPAALPPVPGGQIVELQNDWQGAVYTVLPTRKVFPGEALNQADLDRSCRRIYLAGAPGESEQLLLVFHPAQPAKGLRPEFANLQSGESSIDAENFRLAKVSNVTMPQISNWYGFNGNETGPVPDPVDWLARFDLEAGINNVLLLEVKIPRGTAPGSYTGEFSLKSAEAAFTLPVEVVVWPFAMPEKNTLATMACGVDIDTDPGVFDRFEGVVTHVKYGSNRLKVAVAPDKTTIKLNSSDYFSDLKKLHRQYGIEYFTLPPSLLGGSTGPSQNYLGAGIPVGSEAFEPLHRNFLKTMREAFSAADLGNHAFYYPMDEFPAQSAAVFARIAADAKQEYPAMPVMALTDRWHPELAASKNIDIWCVPWHFFVTRESDPAEWTGLRQQGLQLWSYMNSLYCINAAWNPKAMRFFPVMLARYDYTGALWWHMTAFENKDVRHEPAGLMNRSRQKYMYGSGYLFYPPETSGGAWGSSLRWENYVQGVEDYNLMQLLKTRWQAAEKVLGNSDEAFSADTALAMYATRLSNSFRAQNYYGDALYMNRFRQLLAHDIATLPERPYALVDFEPADTRDAETIHLRGIVEPGSTVTVNGKTPEIWNGGKTFTIEFPLRSGANDFDIAVTKDGKTKHIYREVCRR